MKAKSTKRSRINERNRNQVSVRLDPETRLEIERIAAAEDRKPSHVARIAIREFLQRRKSQEAA